MKTKSKHLQLRKANYLLRGRERSHLGIDIVFVCHNRQALLNGALAELICSELDKHVANHSGIRLNSFDWGDNYVLVSLEYSLSTDLPKLISVLKRESTMACREKVKGQMWEKGYYARSINLGSQHNLINGALMTPEEEQLEDPLGLAEEYGKLEGQ